MREQAIETTGDVAVQRPCSKSVPATVQESKGASYLEWTEPGGKKCEVRSKFDFVHITIDIQQRF